jgi:mannose-1-phosphate guanylyltransferase
MSFELEKNIVEKSKDIEAEKKELLRQSTAYINAGGRGTRLEPILSKDEKIGITKSLIKFGGEDPVIHYHVDRLIKKGFGNVIVNAGDHFNVGEYFTGNKDEKLQVVNSEIQEGTGGDLIRVVRENPSIGKYIVIHNSDTIIEIDEGELLRQHKQSGAAATFAMTRRSDVPNEGAFYISKNGEIIFNKEVVPEYAMLEPKKEDIAYQASSVGVVAFDTEVIKNYDWRSGDGPLSIYTQIIGKLIKEGKVFAYDNGGNFFVDIGTPKNYEKVMRHPILKKILESR